MIGLPARTDVVREVGPAGSDGGSGPDVEVVSGFAPGAPIAMPLWGQKRNRGLEAQLAASPYGEIHRLARELTAEERAPTSPMPAA